MLIMNGTRLCFLKLKEYSDKKNNSSLRSRAILSSARVGTYHHDENSRTNPALTTPLVSPTNNITNQLNDNTSTEINRDRSLLGWLLNCKPCRQVTENQKHKNVC